jgi:hypothetical protein
MWKRILLALLLILLGVSVAEAQYTSTTNTSMKKPNAGLTSGWDVYINGNFDLLDTILGGVSTLTQNSTTPSVSTYAQSWTTNNTVSTAITNFTGGFQGQRLIVVCGDTNTSFTAGANLYLAGGASTISCTSTSTTYMFVLSGTTWIQVGGSGSVNSTNPVLTTGSSLSAGSGSGFVLPGTSLTVGYLYGQGASALSAAQASSSSTLMPGICVAISTTTCLYSGVYRFTSGQCNATFGGGGACALTVGGVIYANDGTAGTMTQTAPTTSGHYVQRIGIALASDTILVNPSMDVGTLQ